MEMTWVDNAIIFSMFSAFIVIICEAIYWCRKKVFLGTVCLCVLCNFVLFRCTGWTEYVPFGIFLSPVFFSGLMWLADHLISFLKSDRRKAFLDFRSPRPTLLSYWKEEVNKI
jgi:hypothetical protein